MIPTKLAHEIEERYRRYLQTTFYFKDPELRHSFERALQSGRLTKGPYLEATPVFKRALNPVSLFHDLLHGQPEQPFLKALNGDRSLYRHQEESIRRVFGGHNAVVATGTGSGKTESFLYPILLHLYEEFQAGTLCPGIRAMVLYPMNALANDQRERLGHICQRLAEERSSFSFTFGQYIGDTPDDEHDSRRHARDHIADRKTGELVLRSEMRTTPPHILLTNYSMLEYLLLRPDDSPLFDDGRAQWWTFLVLDEAHQYRGARGIEMAMLLRRLKQRLREGGRTQPFRCLATSATLVGGEGDKTAVARFAADLFGEEFKDQDVILGEVEPIPQSGAMRLGLADYREMSQVLELGVGGGDRLRSLAKRLGVPYRASDAAPATVGTFLQLDSRAMQLRLAVADRYAEVGEIADRAFPDLPDGERLAATSELVALLLRAKEPLSGAPLLSARYHLFLRSLEGAFLSFSPERSVVLDRRTAGDAALFEIGLCRECGQHYLVGKVSKDKLTEAVRDPSRADFGATFFLPLDARVVDKNEIGSNSPEIYKLCTRCAEICPSKSHLKCDHDASVLLEKQSQSEEREDQIPRCAVCGYQAPDPVREVVHGTDGPHAVIATTLYQELPQSRRKVLAFADGRQEAAFFAWYLENSYKDILSRNLLLNVVQQQRAHAPSGSSMRDLAMGLRDIFRSRNVYPLAASDLQLRHAAWLALYGEFLTDEPRISLEGVGLARWCIVWPSWFRVPQLLKTAPWALSEEEARDLIFVLLDSMRTDHAVELYGDEAVSLNWNDLNLQAAQERFRIGAPGGQHGIASWDGDRTRRARFLARLLKRITPGIAEQAANERVGHVLRLIWDTLRHCDDDAPTSRDRILVPVGDARRLNPDWWRFRSIGGDESIYQCDICNRIQGVSVRRLCARHRCPGSLKEIRRRELDVNHYRLLYEAALPGSLRVEEHTAQLDKEKAREFQREFREGKINILSCSTTFELGVDLGDLDTIFLRNVPPEAFNYAQRVGRSGRRRSYDRFWCMS
jgi:hypothetical protein